MHLLYPIFKTYFEAVLKLNFGDRFVVKITDDKDSLEYIRPDKHVIKTLGTGLMRSPGHPSGNQIYEKQQPFYNTLIKYKCVPLLHKYIDGTVEFLGYYRLINTKIKVSNEGFRYYEFTLQKYIKTQKN